MVNKREKIQQYSVMLTCKCVGRPTMAKLSGAAREQAKEEGGADGTRIRCNKTIKIPLSDRGPIALTSGLIKMETQPFLDMQGWKRLKTLGHYQRLCPSCTKYVLDMRRKEKQMWG